MTDLLPKDPMVSRLRRAALGGADWLNDVADRLIAGNEKLARELAAKDIEISNLTQTVERLQRELAEWP